MRKLVILLILFPISSLLFGQLDAGHIGSDQNICYGYAPETLTFTVQPSGGTTPYTYRWQRSNNNGSTWADISGTSASRNTYAPPILGRSAMFRCRVTDAASSSAYTNSVTVTVSDDLTAGVIEGAQTVFAGTSPGELTQNTAPSGGSGSYSYQWQSSDDNQIWSDVEGAYYATYSPAAVITDTWYRRFVIDESCGSIASNSVEISTRDITLYTTEEPGHLTYNLFYRDYGTVFSVLTDGFITKVRLYCHHNESGVHQIRLWKENEEESYDLIYGPVDWDFEAIGTDEWSEYEITPLAVEAGYDYIISITNGSDNNAYVYSESFTPDSTNSYISYVSGIFGSTAGDISTYYDQGYSFFRDIVFVPFSSGAIGSDQSICYNTAPSQLTQITAPSGGTGEYTFQWQSSANDSVWSDIVGATSSNFSPSALTDSTYYRRGVTSGNFTFYSTSVLIAVDSEFSLAQLHDSITIYENTSTYFNVVISGGTPPYIINYTRNGTPQSSVSDYYSGTDIFTDVLSAGTYTYALTSVTDAFGCNVQSLGTSIAVTVSGQYSSSGSCNVLVLVNTAQEEYYPEYSIYIKPYFDWFGIPYETCDVDTATTLPDFNDYALVIFGHKDVFSASNYPLDSLESAIYRGIGLYSFDPDLFNYSCAFTTAETNQEVTSSRIDLITSHYITQYHINDTYDTTNSVIELIYNDPQPSITIAATNYSLSEGTDLAVLIDTVSTDPLTIYTEPLLQVASYGSGRIVKWSSYDWAFDAKLGPVMGMDDIVWRSIVWAAKKPFVMQGLPPMITMRVDDVVGDHGGASIAEDLEWLKVSNEYGFIPWCGIFTDGISEANIDTLRSLTNRGLATSSPHSFSTEDYIYSDSDDSNIDVLQNIADAQQFYTDHSLPMSKFLVPHAYRIDSDTQISDVFAAISNMGIEFLGTPIYYNVDPEDYPGNWLQCGPYKLNKEGYCGSNRAYFYGGYFDFEGTTFFISLTEIRDDAGYEWYPSSYMDPTVPKAVRQLRRGLNSMVLPTLFTHEYQLTVMGPSRWGEELSAITQALSSYNATYESIDDASEYIRAKVNIDLVDVTSEDGLISISCLGVNDMETKCYLFNESDDTITFRLITIPQGNSSSVPVTIGVAND